MLGWTRPCCLPSVIKAQSISTISFPLYQALCNQSACYIILMICRIQPPLIHSEALLIHPKCCKACNLAAACHIACACCIAMLIKTFARSSLAHCLADGPVRQVKRPTTCGQEGAQHVWQRARRGSHDRISVLSEDRAQAPALSARCTAQLRLLPYLYMPSAFHCNETGHW